MFSEVEITRDVAICGKLLKSQSPSHQQIISRLLNDLIGETACREHGFYLGITALKSISNNNSNNNNNNNDHQEQVLSFTVSFTCRTFLPAKGDILQGVVYKVYLTGVFIRSGPLRNAYLSRLKMPGYRYLPAAESEDEKPCFQKDDLTKIAAEVVVRFEVYAVRFEDGVDTEGNDVQVLATMEDDSLGPISLTGSDEPYM
ncbi:hypothetical protein EUTSA_v10026282mg [Eutrema salsugineum]|uniref:DNA-directed RNA polymerase subunit n=1 Tax=Eutrema salsugineum TaxID=72664 RepID=V4LZP5_EUTSA|nr:DNA-directed RNA polymerase subunit 7-like protein [Eutrema salsugineum]ESQ56150.1 hypothetical protein EUTSA_v10026282mg [Eutrema salsugineum]